MGIVLSDEFNGYSSCVFTGTIAVVAERKQSISKKSGKYVEFAELVVQFRQKDFPEDSSCYISLRSYSKKNADLILGLRRGTMVFGLATIATRRVNEWKIDGTRLFGNVGILLPSTTLFDCIIEQMEKRRYSEELARYKPDPNAIDWSGGSESFTHDVTF